MIKKAKAILPELFFIGLGIYWFLETSMGGDHINYLALIFIALFTIQIFWKNKVLGITLSAILLCSMAYMSLALLSEFSEFEQLTSAALQLIVVGSILILSSVLMSVLLMKKHLETA